MNMQALKTENVTAIPMPAGEVLRLPMAKPSYFTAKVIPAAKNVASNLLPPIVMIVLILLVWQFLCSKPGATLPSPRDARNVPSRSNTMSGWSPRLKTKTRSRESTATAATSDQPQPAGGFAQRSSAS